jgi:hypothetical protein
MAMTPTLSIRALLAGMLSLATPHHGVAQWAVSAGIRAPRFSGAAVEPGTDRSLHPYRPTMVEIGLKRGGRRVAAGVYLLYASCSLALEGSEAVAAIKDALSVYGIRPEVALRLSRLGAEGTVRLHVGPLLEVWQLPDIGSHWRIGLAASVGLEWPLGGPWSAAAQLGGAVTPASPFRQEDLEIPLEPRALWRREGAVALRYLL